MLFQRSLSCAGRVPTLISLALLLALSFIVILTPNSHPISHTFSLRKRDIALNLRQESVSASTVPESTPATESSSPPPVPSPTPSSSSDSEPSQSANSPSASSQSVVSSSENVQSSTRVVESSASNARVTQAQTTTTPPASSATSVAAASSTITSIASAPARPASVSTQSAGEATGGGTTMLTPTGVNPSAPGSTIYANSTDATTTGFWANKGAVAGTFTLVTLILIGIFVVVGANLMKRRRPRRRRRHHRRHVEDIYEKHPTPGPNSGVVNAVEDPEPGMTDLTAQVPMSAYPSHEVHYGGTDPSQQMYQPQQYNTEYPPGTMYNDQQQPHYEQQQSDQYDYDYSVYAGYEEGAAHDQYPQQESSYTPTHPFADPRHSPAPGQAPPVAPHKTSSTYGQSVDSFYGSAGSAPGHAL